MLWMSVAVGVLLSDAQGCPVLLGRARLAYEERKFDVAAAEFTRSLEACGEKPALLIGLAQSYLMAQRLDDALRTLDRTLALRPDEVAALKLKGDTLYLKGDDAGAEKMLLRALDIEPANEPACYALGRIYYHLQRYEDAAAQFRKIVEREPNNYRAHDNLALTYEAMTNDELARKHYFRALELVYKDHPEYDGVYGNLADYYLRHGDFNKAFQLAAEAAKRNPRSARNFFLTGKALWKLDRTDQSVRWLEESEVLDPRYPEPKYLLGRIYRKQGRIAESDRELAAFKELNSDASARR